MNIFVCITVSRSLPAKCPVLRAYLSYGTIIRPDIRTWYAFTKEDSTKIRGGAASPGEEVSDTENFRQLSETFLNREGLSRSSKSENRWFPGIWSLLKAAARPETFPKSQAKSYIARKSLRIYMAADNEIYRWTKVENFWRVSPTFCRHVG